MRLEPCPDCGAMLPVDGPTDSPEFHCDDCPRFSGAKVLTRRFEVRNSLRRAGWWDVWDVRTGRAVGDPFEVLSGATEDADWREGERRVGGSKAEGHTRGGKSPLRAWPLTRTIIRKVARERRSLIVELRPDLHGQGPTITVREAHSRAGFTITIASLHTILAQRAAENARTGRRKRVRRGKL
jgi:hypothetical protein